MINQRHQDLRKGEDLYAQDVSHAIELLRAKWTIPIVCAMRERPVRLSDPTRLSKPEVIGDFGLLTRPAYLSQKSLEISACMVRFGPC